MLSIETADLSRTYKIKKTRKTPASTLVALDKANSKSSRASFLDCWVPMALEKPP